jgi:hypothetical protein
MRERFPLRARKTCTLGFERVAETSAYAAWAPGVFTQLTGRPPSIAELGTLEQALTPWLDR